MSKKVRFNLLAIVLALGVFGIAQSPGAQSIDGAALYAQDCAGCHSPLATSSKKGRTSAQIRAAINNPSYPMSSLASLTTAQIDAIAAALAPDTTPPTVTGFSIPATSASLTVTITTLTATDNVGVTGYMLTESATAPNATAAGWSTTLPTSYTFATAGAKTLYAWAIDGTGNVSNGRSATVTITLPPISDTTPPTVTVFTIPATSSSLTVPINALAATDNVGITGYMVTESATPPGASASGWSASAPSSYIFAGAGSKTLYAWAKDAAGNVSNSLSATVTVTATSPPPPQPGPLDLTLWSGQWLKVKIKYNGYSFGKSNAGGSHIPGKDVNSPEMGKDQENIVAYLNFTTVDPNQGVLQGNLYQFDSTSGQWVSDPLTLHFIDGTPTDFLSWSQTNGDMTAGFTVRIQGKQRGGILTSATFTTLGGYYFEINSTSGASGSQQFLAGEISLNGSLVPGSKVPVPK